MKAKNLKEFKALIERYESITLEEIKEKESYFRNMDNVATSFTGFGDDKKCTLCQPITENDEVNCRKCIYSNSEDYSFYCLKNENLKTFDRICDADTPLKLRNAFRARAKHMKTLINLS